MTTAYSQIPAFGAWAGPRRPKVLLVGEAFGGAEADTTQPFVGESGKELWRMLGEAFVGVAPGEHSAVTGLHRYGNTWIEHRGPWLETAGVAMTNVLNLRPPGNKIEELCSDRASLKGTPSYDLPAISRAKYLRPEFLQEVDRLRDEISRSNPNLLVALGNTACWATLGATNIGSIRGTTRYSEPPFVLNRKKTLATFHPASVLYQWQQRPIVVADLMKASREGQFAEIRRPARRALISPTIGAVKLWTEKALAEAQILASDVETHGGQITKISFAYDRASCLVVPFVDMARPGASYWADQGDELLAWDCVQALLESEIPKVGQNFLYDLQYIWRVGIRPRNLLHDTMLRHHALFPELRKGLGFLGSIYTSEPAWKLMRLGKSDTVKRDE